MPRIKLLLLGLVAVLVMSAAASTSASAATKNRFFVEKTELKGEDAIEGKVETAQLNTVIASLKIMGVCTENSFSEGKIKEKGEASAKMTFSKCKIYEIKAGVLTLLSNCTFEEPVTFSVKEQLIEGPGGMVEDEIKPSSGEVFVKAKITGAACVLKGTYEPKGTYAGSGGDEAERQSPEHSLELSSTGSKLKLGTEPVSIRFCQWIIRIVGAKPWYVE
jgi:hypothetical protein